MRTAKDIVTDYRKRGYNDERLRALAMGRPEPIRSEILAYLEKDPGEEKVTVTTSNPKNKKSVRRKKETEAPSPAMPLEPGEDERNEREESVEEMPEAKTNSIKREEAPPLFSSETSEEEEPSSEENQERFENNLFSQGASSRDPSIHEIREETTESTDILAEVQTPPPILHLQPYYAMTEELPCSEEEIEEEASSGKVLFFPPPSERFDTTQHQEEASDQLSFLKEEEAQEAPSPASSPADSEGKGCTREASSAPLDASVMAETAELRQRLTEMEESCLCLELECQRLSQEVEKRVSLLIERDEEIESLRTRTKQLEAEKRTLEEAAREAEHAKKELAQLRRDFEALERRYNEIATGQVPDLFQDKEDLIELIEAQHRENETMKETLRMRGRRLALAYTTAAAASFLAILLPVLHYFHAKQEAQKHVSAEILAQSSLEEERRQRQRMELEVQTLQKKIAEVQRSHSADRTRWMQAMAEQKKSFEQRLAAATKVEQTIGAPNMTASGKKASPPTAVALQGPQDLRDETASSITQAPRRNEIKGVEDWQRKKLETTTAAAREKGSSPTRFAVVKPGEGLSQVLWREYGTSNRKLLEKVIEMNGLTRDGKGNPIIHPHQQLILPANPSSVALAE